MRIRSSNVFVALVAGALAVGAAPAAAETLTYSTPFAATVPHPCTGEPVALQGSVHTKTTSNSSGDGIKYQIESNMQGVSGTGLVSGARYVMQDQYSEMNHADATNAQFTSKMTSNFIRQRETTGINLTLGSGDDFQLHSLAHLTVSNGVTRANKYDLQADCR